MSRVSLVQHDFHPRNLGVTLLRRRIHAVTNGIEAGEPTSVEVVEKIEETQKAEVGEVEKTEGSEEAEKTEEIGEPEHTDEIQDEIHDEIQDEFESPSTVQGMVALYEQLEMRN